MNDKQPNEPKSYGLHQVVLALIGVGVAVVGVFIAYFAWKSPVSPPSASAPPPGISITNQMNQSQTAPSENPPTAHAQLPAVSPSPNMQKPTEGFARPGGSSGDPVKQADNQETVVSPMCVGFEPWVKYERLSVSSINDGYALAFRVQNNSDKEIAVSTIRTNTLHDDQKNELMLRDTSLPDRLCNPPESCAAGTYRNGAKIEAGTRGSIAYRFLGLGDRKHGTRVSTETTVVLTRKDEDGKFITARKSISCDDVPVK